MNAVDYVVVVSAFPASGSKSRALARHVLPGGQATTAMVALARLGHRTRYVGRVGSDDAGRIQLASLAEDGVDATACVVVEAGASSTSFIIVEADGGERTVVWDGGVSTTVEASDFGEEVATSGRVLLVDGHNVAAEAAAATWARAARIPVVIDVDIDYGGEPLYPLVDFLISSSLFPSRITGIADPRTALAALFERYGCAVVAMTLGERGALALCDGVFVESPALHAEVVDTTGAGDAFHAGFIHGMLRGLGLEETLRVANAVAAMNCGGLGARGALPTREGLQAFLATA